MKTILLTTLLFISSNCFSQNILEYFKIKEIKKIEIYSSPNMNIGDPNTVMKASTDVSFLSEITTMLAELPAGGTIWKEFPQTIPTCRITIFDQNNNEHTFAYLGTKLRTPDNSKGAFYYGKKNHDNETKLYFAIQKIIFED